MCSEAFTPTLLHHHLLAANLPVSSLRQNLEHLGHRNKLDINPKSGYFFDFLHGKYNNTVQSISFFAICRCVINVSLNCKPCQE